MNSSHQFALGPLDRVLRVASRPMFGGIGIHAEGCSFALMDEDRLYLTVDGSDRADLQAPRLDHLLPFAHEGEAWATKAVAVARAARARKDRLRRKK